MSTIENRQKLKALSQKAKAVQDENPEMRINEILVSFYTNPKNQIFKTLNDWKKEGFRVKKGSKAFLIWGRKRKASNHTKDTEKDEFQFFPLCYIFSNDQVEPAKIKENA